LSENRGKSGCANQRGQKHYAAVPAVDALPPQKSTVNEQNRN
jgi:hypothetical protein